MDWNAIIAFAAIIADLAAFGAVYVAYRAFKSQELAFRTSSEAFRLSMSANLISGLEEKFDNETLKQSRHSAAKALLEHQNLENSEDVFDFFETVGLLNRLGALNDEMIHSAFFHLINLYWNAAADYVAKRRAESTSVLWVDFQSLYKNTHALEMLKDPLSKDLQLSKEALTQYLNWELDV